MPDSFTFVLHFCVLQLLYLFLSLCWAILYVRRTQKSRPALGLNSWDKVALQCPRPCRGLSNSAVSSSGCLETPSTGKARSPHGLSFPWVSGSNPAGGSLGFWRSRLPPQSFLPMGIGEATPLLLAISSPTTVFPSRGYRGGDAVTSGDLVSLHSLSSLWASGRRHTGDASSTLYWRRLQHLILAMPVAINLLTLTLALSLTPTLVDAWGRGTCRREKLKVSPAPSTWHFPYG